MKLQYFPREWKKALIVPIPKPGKVLDDPDSYRPVSLLDSMSKVAERVILVRLNKLDSKNNITPRNQFGFRKGHSTTLAAARVVHDAMLKFKSHQNTILLLLDMEKAFDTVWHDGVIYKLHHSYNFPSNLLTLLKSYLSDRTFQVRLKSTLSQPYPIQAGVPQGTVLAPKIYTLYTADIPQTPTSQTILYADDTAIYAHSFYAAAANRKIQYSLDPIVQYFQKWKIKINANKTKQIIFTKKFTNNRIIQPLKINNIEIQTSNKIKYLGLILDKSLSFQPHISASLSRAYCATQNMYPLLARGSRMSLANKATIYKTIIRPVMTYGCPIWQSLSNTQINRLQVMQNKILRLVTDSGRYESLQRMHNAAEVLPVRDYITEQSQTFYTTHIHKTQLTTHLADIKHTHTLNRRHKFIHEGLPIYYED